MKGFKLLLEKFRQSSRKKKTVILAILLVFIFISGALGYVVAYNLHASNRAFSPIGSLLNGNPRQPRNVPDPINGILYTAEEAKKWQDKLPLAVVIENHSDARPQSGLSHADLVYEALAEGGITRFLAIYLAEDTGLGPVRSNRPYVIDWLSEYSAGYAHVGGSPLAQALVQSLHIKNLDQFVLGYPTYERVTSRFAPHNVYTTTKKLRTAAAERGYKGPVNITSWNFSDEEAAAADRPKKFTVEIPYPAFSMDVVWKYDPSSNDYLRFDGGTAHIDATSKKQLFAKDIIVEFVPASLVDSHGRLKMKTIGYGKVLVFKDGKVIKGVWRKSVRVGRTKLYDEQGNAISLNRGKIWVEVVPSDYKLTIKK